MQVKGRGCLDPGLLSQEGLVQRLLPWNALKRFKTQPKLYAKYYVWACVCAYTCVFCVCVVCMLACFWDSHSFWKVFRLIHDLKSKKKHFFFPTWTQPCRVVPALSITPPWLLKKPEPPRHPSGTKQRLVLGEAKRVTSVPSGTGAQRLVERGGLEMEVTWGTPAPARRLSPKGSQ